MTHGFALYLWSDSLRQILALYPATGFFFPFLHLFSLLLISCFPPLSFLNLFWPSYLPLNLLDLLVNLSLISVFLCLLQCVVPLCHPSCISLPGDKLTLLHLCMAVVRSFCPFVRPSCCMSPQSQTAQFSLGHWYCFGMDTAFPHVSPLIL